ncbi:DNA polymerase III subunit gamma/tau [Aromatoleum petrolei]|uniref:DNA polymerase III subunit gamma/tau n=1 Tax=Aromatoleum petrolei TaxID=76116 RepID=A0ABX1MGH5_9RHOO|nr:DNA polymerase III subunit gamma/tau [Aromatoleum petrolei]NMF86883.1 DNA polymerase III subunit gamma/tau [Aromatoleum petrolei]QTQ37472.1 DNA polymerase III gamma subunit/tau [Aromatoleum petrolei]
MSYQVLARKWRPKSFATLVGQEHVVRALSHALATGRLHHAWLFTGTRGVGKTTISRILAKALNCETGVTAEPCNQCSACQAIDADRFPDYVEMDAASNRGVEDMAALLDKAVYAPVQGRYKVYMIDEVHMLTGHAFNAMLKTLEEPPEHVKFILATTDPQKIPVTVLSRCLQFNLKQMPPGHIVEHLSRILEAEAIPFEAPALRHLAKAANGSMRDALSLLDQAIAHGTGKVEEEQVTHMLGTVGDDHLYAVLDALAAGDVTALLAVADRMEARSLSFDAALQALASLLHRAALAQFAPAAISDEAERARLQPYTEAFDAEFLQLAYQIAIHGRDELPLAPDDYAGFTMTLLRLHAFRPDMPAALGSPATEGGGGGVARALPPAAARPPAASHPASASAAPRPAQPAAIAPAALAVAEAPAASAVPARAPVAPSPGAASAPPATRAEAPIPVEARPEPSNSVPPWEDLPPEAFFGQSAEPAAPGGESPREVVPAPPVARSAPVERPEQVAPSAPQPQAPSVSPAPPTADGEAAGDFAAGNWHGLIRRLGLGGLVREFAQHCEWLGFADGVIDLRLSNAHRHLLDMNPGVVERIQDQLASLYGAPLKLRATVGAIAGETPAQRDEADRRARRAEAVAALESDPFVRELIERFDATLVEASVKPL